jgi:hypothetical protein
VPPHGYLLTTWKNLFVHLCFDIEQVLSDSQIADLDLEEVRQKYGELRLD